MAASSKPNSQPASSQMTPRPRQVTRLTNAQAKKIKEDYLKAILILWSDYFPHDTKPTLDDIDLRAYYGTYGEAELVSINCNLLESAAVDPPPSYVAGFVIHLWQHMTLHVGSGFMTIENAYNAGKITKQDVCDMQEYQKYYTTGY